MKKLIVLITLCIQFTLQSQTITGDWYGSLNVQGTVLPLVFHINTSNDGYTSTMDSPKQGAKDIPVPTTLFKTDSLILKIPDAAIEYKGVLKNEDVVGTFTQRGMKFPLTLSKTKPKEEKIIRPQEPKKPYPYYTEDVTFVNFKTDDVALSGTLTLPKKEGKFPAVVLITGSGPQDRNEELVNHKPFLVIADYLTRNGIAVLRYDDRGVGESTGEFKSATTNDFATDVESAVAFLKIRPEIDNEHIGLIGHSEGGIIAPMVAANDASINFIILLAGTGIRGKELLLLQSQAISEASGISKKEIKRTTNFNEVLYDMAIESKDISTLKEDINVYVNKILDNDQSENALKGEARTAYVDRIVKQVANPWMINLLKYNPQDALKNVKCAVLAVNGDKDLQVPAKVNLTAIKKALNSNGNEKVKTITYPNLNHLFQETKTGLPSEYATIEQTFSPKVLDDITNWILNTVK